MSENRWPKGTQGPDPTEAALNDLGARPDRQALFGAAWQASATDPTTFLTALFAAQGSGVDQHALNWLAAHAEFDDAVMFAFGRVAVNGDLLNVVVVAGGAPHVRVTRTSGTVLLEVWSDPDV